MANIAVIYYSSTGNAYTVAQALAAGAESVGAEIRLRKVRELAPDEAIASNKGWEQHRVATQHVAEATLAERVSVRCRPSSNSFSTPADRCG